MKRAITDLSPKQVRMSLVALAAAIMAVVWAVTDSVFGLLVPEALVSAVTALVMLVAQFYDRKNSGVSHRSDA